jgi:hypothetical protein
MGVNRGRCTSLRMDEDTVSKALKSLCKRFKPTRSKCRVAVIASNEMKKVKLTGSGIVAVVQNTKPRGEAGQHWVLWIHSPSGLYFFDSLGRPPEFYKLDQPSIEITQRNLQQFQANDSDVCALYTLYIFYNFLRLRKFKSILKDFSVNRKRRNDARVVSFYNRIALC